MLLLEDATEHGFAVSLLQQLATRGVGGRIFVANFLEFGRLEFARSDAVICHLAEETKREPVSGGKWREVKGGKRGKKGEKGRAERGREEGCKC